MQCKLTNTEMAELAPELTPTQILSKAGFDDIAEGDIPAIAEALREAARLAEPLDEIELVCLWEALTRKLELLKIRNRVKMVSAAFQVYEKSGNPSVSTATLQQSNCPRMGNPVR